MNQLVGQEWQIWHERWTEPGIEAALVEHRFNPTDDNFERLTAALEAHRAVFQLPAAQRSGCPGVGIAVSSTSGYR